MIAVRRAAAILLAASTLMWPALVNGFPLVFYDSVDYLDISVSHAPVIYRNPVYGLLLAPLSALGTVWAVAVAQCLLTALVLHEAVAVFGPAQRRGRLLVALAAALSLFTSIAVYAVQVMPDIFIGLMVLAMVSLACGRALPRWRRLGLALVVAAGAACHMSHLALGIGLLAVLWFAHLVWLRRRLALRLASMAVVAATLAIPSANYLTAGRFTFSLVGDIVLFARVLQDGLVKPYLDAVCPSPDYVLCAHKDDLPRTANDFLWGGGDAFLDLGSWWGESDEPHRILVGSLRMFPLAHLRKAGETTVEQFLMLETGDGTHFASEPGEAIAFYFPHEMDAYTAALQQRDGWPWPAINLVHVPFAFAMMAAVAVLFAASRGRNVLAGAVLAALLGNAFICGVLSNPNHRYQSRIAWLPALAVGLASAGRSAGVSWEARIGAHQRTKVG